MRSISRLLVAKPSKGYSRIKYERLLLDEHIVFTAELAVTLDHGQTIGKPGRDFLVHEGAKLFFGDRADRLRGPEEQFGANE